MSAFWSHQSIHEPPPVPAPPDAHPISRRRPDRRFRRWVSVTVRRVYLRDQLVTLAESPLTTVSAQTQRPAPKRQRIGMGSAVFGLLRSKGTEEDPRGQVGELEVSHVGPGGVRFRVPVVVTIVDGEELDRHVDGFEGIA